MTTAVGFLAGCRSAEILEVAPDARPKHVQAASYDAQFVVSKAGCTLGIRDGINGSRVTLLSRSELPFALPAVDVQPESQRVLRMRVARVSVALPAPRESAMLACLVPAARGSIEKIHDAVAKVDVTDWERIARRVSADGVVQPTNLSRAVSAVLLDSTLKSWRTVSPTPASRFLAMAEPGGQRLATMYVRASANVVVFDIDFANALFSSNFESVVLTWEMEIAQQQWNQDCDDWNAEMDIWEATRSALEEAADEQADEIEALANALESSIGALETANASCEVTNGKPVCVDFFMTTCRLLILAGDCRHFDRNADYASSRVQLYFDDLTGAVEVKFNCTRFVIPNPVQANGPDWTITSVCDSADVFNPATDLTVTGPDAEGFRSIRMVFRNNACIRRLDFACPSIDATIKLKRNPAGGFFYDFSRDGYPSMGIYSRNASNTYWDTVVEDPQKTRDGVFALRGLAGQVRSQGYNYPPPGGQPDGCMRQ